MKGGGVAPGGLYHFVRTGVTICTGLGEGARLEVVGIDGIVWINTFMVVVSSGVVLSVGSVLVLPSSTVVDTVLSVSGSVSNPDMSVEGSSVVEDWFVSSSSASAASSAFKPSMSWSEVPVVVANRLSLVILSEAVTDSVVAVLLNSSVVTGLTVVETKPVLPIATVLVPLVVLPSTLVASIVVTVVGAAAVEERTIC
uniref:(northern house mosquito) hypothetical protein n=1 Tax=Culex pipiens TaxID=7175 RepID=A0A8D8I4I1_CULPI